MLDKQQKLAIVEQVRLAMIRQNCKSIDIADICKYRGSDNSRCVIGVFIKDEFYDPEIEGAAIRDLLTDKPKCMKLRKILSKSGMDIKIEELPFFIRLQTVHDWADDFQDMLVTLDKFTQEISNGEA